MLEFEGDRVHPRINISKFDSNFRCGVALILSVIKKKGIATGKFPAKESHKMFKIKMVHSFIN
jgi:hypothetical protein